MIDLVPAGKLPAGFLPVLQAYDYAGDEVVLVHADDDAAHLPPAEAPIARLADLSTQASLPVGDTLHALALTLVTLALAALLCRRRGALA